MQSRFYNNLQYLNNLIIQYVPPEVFIFKALTKSPI